MTQAENLAGLSGKTALVTGGSRGIGRAVCLRLAGLGARVYVNYVSRADSATTVVAEIEKAGGKAAAIGFDVADGSAVQSAIAQIVGEAGGLDILVNNAGITRDSLILRMKEEDWDAVLDTNLKGAFLCAKAAAKPMMKQRGGRIINISSVSGISGNAGQVNYSAAKAGLIGLSKSLARELAPRKITVNCIAPGFIESEMLDTLPQEMQEELKKSIPLGGFGSTEDIAGAAAYLASDDAGYITGETLHINGGMYMV